MPQNVRYVASRSLIAGHTAEVPYYMNLKLNKKDRQRQVNRERQEMLTGAVATTYHGGNDMWICATPALTLTEAQQMREFLDSVEDGQQFTFDPLNAVGTSPTQYVNVVIETNGYTEKRFDRGGDQTGDYFAFAWTMRVIP